MLLDGVEAAVQQVQDTAAGRTGRLRVGLAATASLDLTPLALRAFAEAVPGAQSACRTSASTIRRAAFAMQ